MTNLFFLTLQSTEVSGFPLINIRLLDATIELPYCFSWFERTRWKQTGQANERLWGLWELSVYENHIPEKNIVLGHSKRQHFGSRRQLSLETKSTGTLILNFAASRTVSREAFMCEVKTESQPQPSSSWQRVKITWRSYDQCCKDQA
uniref:uncharacterized protein LOC114678298 isoform X2 n=1 Tax=Macaca mulatta TaxID=9544 RepID=UPI0010A2891A|nr:uncharacterized protein LOC114678298 isoform X2 [Macaca mulatta]